MKSSSVFDPQSTLGHPIFSLLIVILIIMAVILTLVTGLVVYSSIRYRRRAGQPDPPPNFGNPKLEVTWTVLPLLLLVAIFTLTVITMGRSDPPTRTLAPDLVIIGHQWWWEVRYPGTGVVTANEVHLPAGRKMLARLESNDVIHDFWVPQLGRKMDMIPGSPNELWLEADSPGIYLGSCAEYCGDEHGWMRIRVIAKPQAEFKVWEQQQAAPAPALNSQGAEARLGAQIFLERSCANCHAIAGTGTTQRIGPDLTHVASRQTLAAGRLENTPENLAAWLQNPEKFKPGSHMPNLQLQPDEVRALTAYLETLR
jgi:cytochrome c oxidase subunit II